MKQTANSLVLSHLVMCANKAIAEHEVVYTDGEYTAKHLATCQPAPVWDGKADELIFVDINGKHTSCPWSKVFDHICEFGGENEVFKFATAKKQVTLIAPKAAPKPEAPKPESTAPKATAPEVSTEGKKETPKKESKPKAKGKQKTTIADGTKSTIIGTCIEFSKSVPCTKVVRNAKHLEALPTLYYYYDEKADISRIYKLRSEDSDLCMVGAVKGDALADIERIKSIDKYKVIAAEGLQAAISKGLINDMPHFKE